MVMASGDMTTTEYDNYEDEHEDEDDDENDKEAENRWMAREECGRENKKDNNMGEYGEAHE